MPWRYLQRSQPAYPSEMDRGPASGPKDAAATPKEANRRGRRCHKRPMMLSNRARSRRPAPSAGKHCNMPWSDNVQMGPFASASPRSTCRFARPIRKNVDGDNAEPEHMSFLHAAAPTS